MVATLIGNILHIAFKIYSLWKNHKKANLEFSIGKFFKDDKWAIIVDFMASFALVYVVDEWLNFNEYIIGKIKSIFVFIGFTGSYVITLAMGVAERKFRAAIDHKSNIADSHSGTLDKPTPTE